MNKLITGIIFSVAAIFAFVSATRIVREMPHHVDVGNGTVLEMHVEGKSGPVVVLEMEPDPEFVLRLARDFRVVEYQRAGWGNSFVENANRDAATAATELHTGLGKLKIAPPYYFVGDRMGSLFVRKFSQSYSTEVKGALLLDPYVEEPGVKAWITDYQRMDPVGHAELLKTLKDVADQAADLRDFIEALRAHERIKFHKIVDTLSGDQKQMTVEAISERLRTEESNREIYGFITGFKGAEKNEILSLPKTAAELAQGGISIVPTVVITPTLLSPSEAAQQKALKAGEIEYRFKEQDSMVNRFTRFTHLHADSASDNIVSDDPELVLDTLKKLTSN